MRIKFSIIFQVLLFSSSIILAQDSLNKQYLYTASIDDLLILPIQNNLSKAIVSASKKEEKLFDAPLSASVITREELIQAGVTSIQEAMRLIPGMIVREFTNGQFDVGLRGLENLPTHASSFTMVSRTSLVMIDNRPIYNYLNGGTFWESLPISLYDLDRIEVVRGVASSLYGTNAVTGVINLITRKPEHEKVQTSSNVSFGNFNSSIINTSISYQINNKLNVGMYANYEARERPTSLYYEINRSRLVPLDSLVPARLDVPSSYFYQNVLRAVEKSNINFFLDYSPTSSSNLTLKAGLQRDEGHSFYYQNDMAPLYYSFNNSQYLDLHFQGYNFSAQASYLSGTKNPSIDASRFSYKTADAYIEYDFDKVKNLNIRPLLFFRRIIYDHDEETDPLRNNFLTEGKVETSNYAFGVKLDYLFKKFRFIGAGRMEKFEIPNAWYLAYQFASTYKPAKHLLLRAVYGRANTSAFFFNTNLNVNLNLPITNNPLFQELQLNFFGNQELELTTSDMFEFGARIQIGKKLAFDFETFISTTQNFFRLIEHPPTFIPPRITYTNTTEQIPLRVKQQGLTFSVDYTSQNLSIRPYITIQKTDLFDHSPYKVDPALNPDKNWQTLADRKHLATPSFFGGILINYQPIKKLNINLHAYFFDEHELSHVVETTVFNDTGGGIATISRHLLGNTKLSYQLNSKLSSFVSVRNLFSNKFQYFYTDPIQTNYWFGINFEL